MSTHLVLLILQGNVHVLYLQAQYEHIGPSHKLLFGFAFWRLGWESGCLALGTLWLSDGCKVILGLPQSTFCAGRPNQAQPPGLIGLTYSIKDRAERFSHGLQCPERLPHSRGCSTQTEKSAFPVSLFCVSAMLSNVLSFLPCSLLFCINYAAGCTL